MLYQDILTSFPYAVIGVCLLGMAPFVFVYASLKTGTDKGFLMGILVVAMLCGGFVLSFSQMKMIQETNNASLIANIERRYEVDEVKLEAYNHKIQPEYTGEQPVHVVIDGETYQFYLSQDENTWEPTLTGESHGLKAEELLK